MSNCRFAPSTTGLAHPGTMLSALLSWLDARSKGLRFIVRMEDLDPQRCSREFSAAMREDLAWFGLDWDELHEQHALAAQHDAAMDRLELLGLLYPSSVSRTELAAIGRRAPDDSWAYDNRERGKALPAGGWRACVEPIRCRLPDRVFAPHDEGKLDLSQQPSLAFGDPIVRRRDGAIAYHLAVVVDDAAASVSRVVRGRDIATSTATQAALQEALSLPAPTYRHHFLLLEEQGRKLAKLHGSVSMRDLRANYSAGQLCGFLAYCCGLRPDEQPCSPRDLVAGFAWGRVAVRDRLLRWDSQRLRLEP
jgi:glutamyl/glutaminyl-tRNA synthetase